MKVVKIADYFNILEVTKYAVMLRLFLTTLKNLEKRWAKSLLASSITTCDNIKLKFIPPLKIAKFKEIIHNFEQLDGVKVFKTWD